MFRAIKKRFENADERKLGDKATFEIVRFDGAIAIRGTYGPGWKWSECEQTADDNGYCQQHHFGLVVTGEMLVRMNDGTVIELVAGDVSSIPPGHDAWVVGPTPCVFLDFQLNGASVK